MVAGYAKRLLLASRLHRPVAAYQNITQPLPYAVCHDGGYFKGQPRGNSLLISRTPPHGRLLEHFDFETLRSAFAAKINFAYASRAGGGTSRQTSSFAKSPRRRYSSLG
jgi:hypothetical protein